MLKAYEFRIYPSRAQEAILRDWLALCCELYNAALQERRGAYNICHKSINYTDQQDQLPEIKEIRPELREVHSQVLQDILRRLDNAFDAFFRRVKAGEKLGYPRFRSRSRYDSFTFSQSGFSIENNKLRLSKIGNIKIKLHRPIEGKIKTLTIRRSSTGKWYACLTVECEPQPLPASTEAVGVDVGLKSFATLSTGEEIANPGLFRTEEKGIAKAQRKMDAAKKGSPERRKRRKVVARIHERIANKRRDFAHKESRKIVNRFGIIIFEALNISGMLSNTRLAKSIADAAWSQLVSLTTYKAENAGRCVAQFNPRNTSQICSGCGEIVEKSFSVRIHKCVGCGLVLDRDHNAAINILTLGLQSLPHLRIEAAHL
jgi:putative transposase